MLAEADDLVEDALGDFPLGGFGDFDDFFASDDGDGVAVGVEADAFAGNVVDHDGVEVLRNQLLAGVFEDIFCFGGEADDDLRVFFWRKFFQNVGGGFEFQSHRAFALDLLPGGGFRAIVGDGGGLDHDGGLRKQVQHSVAHFFGRLDARNFGGAGRRERSRPADQKNARATAQGGFGEGVSHASAGAVGQIAHGIDFFAGGAGGDQHGLAS